MEKKIFKGFYYIWAWQPSWSTDRDHFSNLSFPHPKEAPYEIWAKLAQRLQRRSRLKMLTDGRTHARTDGRRTKSDHNSSSWAELRWANNNTKCHLLKFFTQHAKLSVNCRKITVVLQIPMFALKNKKFIKPFWWSKKAPYLEVRCWLSYKDCLTFMFTWLSEHPDVQGWSKPKYTEPKKKCNTTKWQN